MPACRYIEEIGLAAMLATKRSAGVTPEVNLKEFVTHMPLPSANKAAHSGFKTQRRCHQKSKSRVSMASQKGFLPFKHYFFKKNIIFHGPSMKFLKDFLISPKKSQ